MAQDDVKRIGIRKGGNAGLLAATTGGNDLLHTLDLVIVQTVTFPARVFVIRKIMWYNNTGGNVTLRFGTLNNVPVFADRLPTILAINTFHDALTEAELPYVEFTLDTRPGAAGMNGNAYVLASAVGVMVAIEVEEFN